MLLALWLEARARGHVALLRTRATATNLHVSRLIFASLLWVCACVYYPDPSRFMFVGSSLVPILALKQFQNFVVPTPGLRLFSPPVLSWAPLHTRRASVRVADLDCLHQDRTRGK